MIINKTDLLVEDSIYKCSLNKLLEITKVKDIEFYFSKPFSNDVLFHICNIVLEDGTKISVGAEHDEPYLELYREFVKHIPNLSEEYIEKLWYDWFHE